MPGVVGFRVKRSSDASGDLEGWRPRSHQILLFLATAVAVCLGLAQRLVLRDTGSLWLDELWTLDAISRPFKEMIGSRLVSDQSPPLWTSTMWLWLRAVGSYDVAALRLFPVLFGVIAVGAPLVAAFRLGRSLRPTLLVMSSLLGLSTYAIQFSVELRPYSMMIAFGTIATVVWAGLLTSQLRRSGGWIFVFAVTGALGGFTHYYGNALYAVESIVLLGVFARDRAWRTACVHGAWALLSVVPIIGWYLLTRPWARDEAVAAPPTIHELERAAAFALAPVSNAVTGTEPGYAAAQGGFGLLTLVFLGLVIGAVGMWRPARTNGALDRDVVTVAVGGAGVVAAVACLAWIGSVLLPPSMNIRNLSVLLPAVFLAIAAAATVVTRRGAAAISGSLVTLMWIALTILVVSRYGASSSAPQWQLDSGYRAATRALVAAMDSETQPILIGVEASWDWHGQWDAALASTVDAEPPSGSGAPSPIKVTWVLDPSELPDDPPEGPLIVFADDTAGTAAQVFAWAEAVRGPCLSRTYGGPGFGEIHVLECP